METTQQTDVTVAAPRRELVRVEDSIALFDSARFDQMQRISRGMSMASLIPKHLKGDCEEEGIANCLMVVNQAQRWGIDPYSCAGETYVVGGKLGYQGKLIAAIVNSRSNIASGLKHVFNSKQGDELAVVIYGSTSAVIAPEAKPLLKKLAEDNDRSTLGDLEEMGVLAVRLSVGQAKTQNDMWKRDPEQKLIYSGSIRWARRFRPEIILGVKIDDDIERETEIPKAAVAHVVQTSGTSSAPEVKTITAQTEVVPPATKSKRKPTAEAPAEPAKTAEPAKDEEKPAAAKQQPDAAAKTDPGPFGDEPQPSAPATETGQKAKLPPVAEEEPAATQNEGEDDGTASAENLVRKAVAAGFDEALLVKMAIRMNLCPTTVKAMADVPEAKRQMILDDWNEAVNAMTIIANKEASK